MEWPELVTRFDLTSEVAKFVWQRVSKLTSGENTFILDGLVMGGGRCRLGVPHPPHVVRYFSNEFIQRVFDVMRKAPWHRFQVLTKRSERLREFSTEIDWPGNVWMGVSIENQDYIFRANHLRETKAQIKFLLLEPLLGPIAGLDLSGIDWVIVGGESGPGARPLSEEWVVGIYNQCMESGVPFFFQRWGDVKEKRVGRTEGGTWEETPIVIKVRGGTE